MREASLGHNKLCNDRELESYEEIPSGQILNSELLL